MGEFKLDFKVFNEGKLQKAMGNIDKMNEQFGILSDKLASNKKSLGELADFKTIRFLDAMEEKFIDISKSTMALQEVGGFSGLVTSKIEEMVSVLDMLGGGGTLGRLKGISLVLYSWAAPIALVSGLIFTLFKAWQWNIGNVQTEFKKFWGTIKTQFAVFEKNFRELLYLVGPALSGVFKATFGLAIGLIKAFFGVLNFAIKVAIKFRHAIMLLGGAYLSYKGYMLGVIAVQKIQTAWTKKQIVMQKAAVIWTKAITAAQWLWNAALMANPIGLIVAGIVALGASLVWAEKKFGIFSKAVEGWKIAWDSIVNGFKIAWEWLKKIFTTTWENSPLGLAIKGIKKVSGFFSGGDEPDTKTTANLVNGGSAGVNNTDNRQANVTINTTNLNEGNMKAVNNNFVNPYMRSNQLG